MIVEPEGTAKLIDFGIALPPDATSLTRTGLVLGTERFSAPEVLEGEPATERADLYSCGVLLRACEGERSWALENLIGALSAEDPHERPLSAEHALDLLEVPEPGAEQPTEVLRPRPVGSDRRKLLAGLVGLFVVLAIVAIAALSGGGDSDRDVVRQQPQAKAEKAEKAPAAVPVEQPDPEPEPSGPEPDPTRAAALNDEGFALIAAGEPEAAVPLLEEAVASFPEGTGDLNYAYALYNLGNALRLSGRPAEAIPILERRLEIPDQENAVLSELEAARVEAAR